MNQQVDSNVKNLEMTSNDQDSVQTEEVLTHPAAEQYSDGDCFYLDPKAISRSSAHFRKVNLTEKLEELTASISEQGMIQPIVVMRVGENFQVVAGARRLEVALQLNSEKIQCIFKEAPTAFTSLAENMIRENLTAMELSEILGDLKRQGLSHEELARKIGKSVPTVSELINLSKLPQTIKDECSEENKVPQRVLVEIARLGSHEEMITAFEDFKAGISTTREQVRKRPPVGQRAPISTLGKPVNSIIKYLKEHDAANLTQEDTETLKKLKQLIEEKLNSPQVEAA